MRLAFPFKLSPREIAPPILSALIAFALFVWVGGTPMLRAAGMALAVAGIALTLRRMGGLLAICGGLALALSPALWSQTGGAQDYTPGSLVFLLIGALALAAFLVALSSRPYVVLVIALVVFAILFSSQVGLARSLRLNVIASAWLIYLLFNAIAVTNPRPDGPPPALLGAQYRAGLMLILGIGVINDPLFVLFVPVVVLGLAMSKSYIPPWYWAIMVIVAVIGVRGVTIEYVNPQWWNADPLFVRDTGWNVPFIVASGWRAPIRWVELFGLVAAQFTIVGLLLGVFGLARMARWYPVLGVAMQVLWGLFFSFGLVYFGRDREALLLPLFMTQVILMTYAVYAFGEWLERAPGQRGNHLMRYAAAVIYALLPLAMLAEIIT